MKKFITPLILVCTLLVSCKKDRICECIYTKNSDGSKSLESYTFKDTKSHAQRDCDFLESTYNSDLNNLYEGKATCKLK